MTGSERLPDCIEGDGGLLLRLGFALLEEVSREPRAPGETDIEQHWRLTRTEAAALGWI